MNKEKFDKYLLGQNAGSVFAEKVNKLLAEFKDNYKAADPNFDDDVYVEGFLEAFVSEFDINS